jgi:hypothetical protein
MVTGKQALNLELRSQTAGKLSIAFSPLPSGSETGVILPPSSLPPEDIWQCRATLVMTEDRECNWIQRAEIRDAALYPTMHRKMTHPKEVSGPTCHEC